MTFELSLAIARRVARTRARKEGVHPLLLEPSYGERRACEASNSVAHVTSPIYVCLPPPPKRVGTTTAPRALRI